MMKKIVAYVSGVPSPAKSQHKVEVLRRFIVGVNKCGDNGIVNESSDLVNCDVAVIQGWVHKNSPSSPHLNIRRKVSANQFNKHTIIIDSNLFNYNLCKDHLPHYSRYSIDGVFPTTGNYFNSNPDPARWKKISKDLGLSLKDWRVSGDHILLACQRNGGWSMRGYEVADWVNSTIKQLRKYTDRPVIVRGHPGDKKANKYLNQANKDYQISKNQRIIDDFKNAWAVITYNSSPGVAAAIEGIPVFVTDPTPQISQAYDVANIDLSNIENPKLFERTYWVERLSMCHWNFDELSNGSAWKHMRGYL